MDARSSRERNARDNRLAVVGTGNRTDAGSSCEGDTRDNGLAVISGNNGSVVVYDGLAAKDNGSTARDDRSAVDNNGLTANQTDAGPGNKPDADMILTTDN